MNICLLCKEKLMIWWEKYKEKKMSHSSPKFHSPPLPVVTTANTGVFPNVCLHFKGRHTESEGEFVFVCFPLYK